jgi:hypothetical protein
LGNISDVPSRDYTGSRRRVLELEMSTFSSLDGSDDPLTITIDSTGVRVLKIGEWIDRQHGVKKKYLRSTLRLT